MSTEEELHKVVMEKVQEEWEENADTHRMQRYKHDRGIQSSQISAVIKFLIEVGVITKEDL